ncbi:phosphate acetyltransferase [Rhodanobacter denitrificans]|uniref:Phosphate acetyltransferase n=1 Tax=Rhodanobacter denitrificans TaxID=666685 RepID=A0A368KG00_9GAMM|nr:bifunctional enoyl-CoA hydratase/phosphate acetyltransferase [Rhodanobacter denitrificans]RCS30767.1 phosphate acetyltransferase [Rhodanobacter denitrificans]
MDEIMPDTAAVVIRNRIFDEIAIGDSATVERVLTAADVQLLATLYGDGDPQRLDPACAALPDFHDTIGHGIWGVALISAALDMHLPGAGTACLEQALRFHAPMRIGDTLAVQVCAVARDAATRQIRFACRGVNQHGVLAIDGTVEVIAPAERIEYTATRLPAVRLPDGDRSPLVARALALGAIRIAVVHPCDETSLGAALDARTAGLIEPVLVAPRAKLAEVARRAGLDLAGIAIEDVPHSHAAAARAVELAAGGRVDALMKGSLHTDELMAAVVASAAGLRTARRISHCYLMHSPAYPRPFIITDGAVNIAPTLEEKADIVRNAIYLAHILGVATPRVAILAAVETINPRMQTTLDAAALCKMADRGQIAGAVLDGPLAFDNAISAVAARIKGIVSDVAGLADILLVPDLESGNMLAKQLEYLGGASSAAVVMGARVPIVLTSRADSRESRIASCALAALVAHRYRLSPP